MKRKLLLLLFTLSIGLCFSQNVTQLIADAEADLKNNHWEQAYDEFQTLVDNHSDDLTYYQRAIIYDRLGFLNLAFLDPDKAEGNLNLSLLYHEEAGIPNEVDFADALINMGMLYLKKVEFDLSREYVQKALDILKKRPENSVDYLIARTKLARIYEEAGSYTLALSIYNDSYDKLVAMGNDLSPDFAEICTHKGRILVLTGEPREGERFINLSSTIYETLGPQYNVQRAESMEDLALFLERMGRYDEAEKLLLEILDLKRSIPDEADILIIETLNDLGIMYHHIGEIDKAESMFKEVVLECEENLSTNHPFYATAKNNLGSIAIKKGDFSTAKYMLEDALITFKERFGAIHPYYANALNNLARVERKLGNTGKAERYYHEVLKVDRRIFGPDHPNYATTLLNIGVLFSATGREIEAEEYYSEALHIRERSLGVNHPSYGSALEYMGMHYLATNNFQEAEKYFRKSIEIQIGQVRALFPIMVEKERELFYTNLKEDVDRYNYIASSLLVDNPGLIKNIFDFQVKTRTILFNTLDKVHDLVEGSSDEDLRVTYQRWLSDKRLLASYYQMGIEELAELHINLGLIEADLQQQESNLKRQILAFEEALPHDKVDWQYVLEQVKPGEVIVEMVRIAEYASLFIGSENLFGFTDKTSYLAIVFNNGNQEIDFVMLGDNEYTDEQHFARYLNSIENNINEGKFFDSYWKPLMDKLEGVNTIRMVPDGIFNTMNPNMIPKGDGSYVIDHVYVAYLTGIFDLFKPDAIVYNPKVYLFGAPDFDSGKTINPLGLSKQEGSEAEIQAVQNLTSNWQVSTFLNRDANELRLRSAYNPTILHINTNGFLGEPQEYIHSNSPVHHPLFRSGLFMTGASVTYDYFTKGIPTISENDGFLTTYETMNLDLNRTRLVVLSSLQPSVDNPAFRESYYGLLCAFKVAGARNIISETHSSEAESRVELLELFYKRFMETDRIEESLKNAQLELRKKYDDPKAWGSFILTGKGS